MEAFGELYQFFAPRTQSYLTSVVGADLSGDVQQEAWITVLNKVKDLENPKRFKAWLYRLVRHRAIDYLRRVQREERLFDNQEADSIDPDGQSEILANEHLDVESIKSAISMLSPVHQEVVFLRYWEEFSYAEIALVTRVPVGSVRSRLYHAKAHLKKLFETEIDPF